MNRLTLEFSESLVPQRHLASYYQSRNSNAGFLLCFITVTNLLFDVYDIVSAVIQGDNSRLDFFLDIVLESDSSVLLISIIFFLILRRRTRHIRGLIATACFVLLVPMIEVMLIHPGNADSIHLL